MRQGEGCTGTLCIIPFIIPRFQWAWCPSKKKLIPLRFQRLHQGASQAVFLSGPGVFFQVHMNVGRTRFLGVVGLKFSAGFQLLEAAHSPLPWGPGEIQVVFFHSYVCYSKITFY